MIRVNEHYAKLHASYLFAEIDRRVADFQQTHPEKEVIKLGIGDVTEPLPQACLDGFSTGVEHMGTASTFRGYGPYEGYAFLREKIAEIDYHAYGTKVQPDEIFVSDGAKCDTGNIQELFAPDTVIAVPDPVYPVYVDTNVMAGRTGAFENGRYTGLTYLECTAENDFVPTLPARPVDVIYLCFPNNPTGATIDRARLAEWVEYARRHKALILYDAAYVEFISDPELPRSIFEIPGAEELAIEFRSFSKSAGFTGVRCAYTVIPKKCMAYDAHGQEVSLHAMWLRRQSTKSNGVSYPVQMAAAAAYSEEGRVQTKALIDYYMGNAKLIRQTMQNLGYRCVGGDNSPYIWIECKRDSWEFFDLLLKKAAVVCTPGSGFGKCGEGYIRISAFNNRQRVEQALERMREILA